MSVRTIPATLLDKSWCAWHEAWETTMGCAWCDSTFPTCYGAVHLRYACTGYEGYR